MPEVVLSAVSRWHPHFQHRCGGVYPRLLRHRLQLSPRKCSARRQVTLLSFASLVARTPRDALSPPGTAYAISDLIPEDLVVPRCGMSDAFANHRRPRTSWRSRKEADAAPRGTLFFAGPGNDGDHESQWAEGVRHQARIIRGRQSMRNAWPWQVRNH